MHRRWQIMCYSNTQITTRKYCRQSYIVNQVNSRSLISLSHVYIGIFSIWLNLRRGQSPGGRLCHVYYSIADILILEHLSRWSTCTSSPAVAERPRDAPCLSVVSFNITIRGVQSSVRTQLLRLQIYRCIQINSLLFSSLRRIHWCVAVCAVNTRAP